MKMEKSGHILVIWEVQLTLEQHEFELHGATYYEDIFPIVNTTVLHYLRLGESADEELRI